MQTLKKIAITGASGFVGSYVLEALMKLPATVVAVTRDASRLEHLADRIDVVEMDLSNPCENPYEMLGRPDVLIHLAWDGLPNYMSLHHFEKELPCHYSFLKKMVEGGLPSMAVTGTCFEYGMQSGELSEEMSARPENPYGYAKDVLHRQLLFLQQQQDFNLTWFRLFYMYGDGQPKTAIYSQLKQAVEQGDEQFNMSGGEQLRDFLPVNELGRIVAEISVKGEDSGTVNVCSGVPVSIRALVEKWLAENGWDIQLNLGYYPYPTYEPMAFWGSAERLKQILAD